MLESRQQHSRQQRCHTTVLKLQDGKGQAKGEEAKQCSRAGIQAAQWRLVRQHCSPNEPGNVRLI